ncbi:MAG: hypothetical protein J5762_02720 [Clostridia bacterium]|nr:hypothetical protein [Clostridia bacterium]
MLYEISNGILSVKINDLGAEISSVVYNGVERVWQNDNGSWSGKSPVLFPVCGNRKVIVDGVDRKIPFHGFARRSVFKCESAKSDVLTFSLRYNEDTLKVYPYKFELKITYALKENAVVITNAVTDLDEKPMYFALGRHDSFNLPVPVGECALIFDKDEVFSSQQTDETARLIDSFVDFGSGRKFVLPESFLTNGNTVIFGGVNSDRVFLKTVDNEPIAELFFENVRNVLIWRPEGAKMVCVELWSALPDNSGDNNEVSTDTGFIRLEAKETKAISLEIKYY